MANYQTLKSSVQQVIKTNGNKEITGAILQQTLLSIIDSLGVGFQYIGVATPETSPGTQDQNVFYVGGSGTYPNFSGAIVPQGYIGLFKYNGSWTSETVKIADIATLESDVAKIIEAGFDVEETPTNVPLTVHTQDGSSGYYTHTYSVFIADNSRRTCEIINVNPGEKYLVSTHLGSSLIAAALFYDVDGSYLRQYWNLGTGVQQDLVDEPLIIPSGVYKVRFQSANTTAPTVKKVDVSLELKSYTKAEADQLFALKTYAYSKLEADQLFALKTDLQEIIDLAFDSQEIATPIELTMYTEGGVNGFRLITYGQFQADNSRRTSELVNVTPGEKYLVSTHIGTPNIAAVLMYYQDGTYSGQYWNRGTGVQQDLVDELFIVPDGIYKIVFQNAYATPPIVKKVTQQLVLKSYTKDEADARFAPISATPPIKKYGVKWAINNDNDLGQRCFDAVGMTAQIGIGPTNGQSDFDSVFPWSEMKRCNIKTNANGAKIVTFEGETGFALDGSNGNVFVRIPKFYSERYTENGEEYIVISSVGNTVHPAFVEDGKELNEIFVAAFEGRIIDGKLSSRSGVIPSNNETGQTFLDAAKANGDQYTLYDMRAVDALWRLMAVEYGCRNSNQILGWGYSDYQQPIDHPAYRVSVAATNTNTVTLGLPIDDYERLRSLARFTPGATITICNGSQFEIVAQRVVTAVSQPTVNDNLVITFDGAGVDVTTDMWVGSAPCVTNRCETIDSTYRLAWHTGRASYNPGSYINPATFNPCRYRWVENIVGSCWHILPDISFNAGQMYVCQNMKDYVMHKITAPYIPTGDVLPINSDNGNKSDITNANYWVTKLMNDVFARGVNFGTAYNKALTSTKAFGAYYYLYNTRVAIVNGGGFDHLWRSNILTNRAWFNTSDKWYLYGGRLMFKNIQ